MDLSTGGLATVALEYTTVSEREARRRAAVISSCVVVGRVSRTLHRLSVEWVWKLCPHWWGSAGVGLGSFAVSPSLCVWVPARPWGVWSMDGHVFSVFAASSPLTFSLAPTPAASTVETGRSRWKLGKDLCPYAEESQVPRSWSQGGSHVERGGHRERRKVSGRKRAVLASLE